MPTVVGERLFSGGQGYVFLGFRPYQMVAGAQITVQAWTTHCAKCGASFELFTTRGLIHQSRRCTACKQPGKRVKSKKRTRK